MTKPRIPMDFPDLSDFEPSSTPPQANKAEIKAVAQQSGFTARHAPQAAPTPAPAPFDARSLRRTNRTEKLNIAVTAETRTRFWAAAQSIGSTSGEDVLIAMMDAFERELEQGRG